MIHRPPGIGRFGFAVLSALRAAQLIRGCRPRVDGEHKPIMTAQIEVSEGKVRQMPEAPKPVPVPVSASPNQDDRPAPTPETDEAVART